MDEGSSLPSLTVVDGSCSVLYREQTRKDQFSQQPSSFLRHFAIFRKCSITGHLGDVVLLLLEYLLLPSRVTVIQTACVVVLNAFEFCVSILSFGPYDLNNGHRTCWRRDSIQPPGRHDLGAECLMFMCSGVLVIVSISFA